MSSFQLTVPGATNRILNKMEDKVIDSKRGISYSVEPITENTTSGYKQYYKVLVKWLNGITVNSYLCSNESSELSKRVLIEGDEIPNTVISHGKLYDVTTRTPYYVNPRANTTGNNYLVLANDLAKNTFYVVPEEKVISVNGTTGYECYAYTYDYVTNSILGTATNIGPNIISFVYEAYIECPITDEHNIVENKLLLLNVLPIKENRKQECFSLVVV